MAIILGQFALIHVLTVLSIPGVPHKAGAAKSAVKILTLRRSVAVMQAFHTLVSVIAYQAIADEAAGADTRITSHSIGTVRVGIARVCAELTLVTVIACQSIPFIPTIAETVEGAIVVCTHSDSTAVVHFGDTFVDVYPATESESENNCPLGRRPRGSTGN